MAPPPDPAVAAQQADALERENQRLLTQAAEFASDDWREREAARWRNVSPADRLAETFRLCRLVPWWRSLWSSDLRARIDALPSHPPEVLAVLEHLKRTSDATRHPNGR